MSAIRPPVPSPLFPAQSPPSPARASRSDFFRAALDRVGTDADAASPVPTAPAVSLARVPDDRPQRPGSLVDIRV